MKKIVSILFSLLFYLSIAFAEDRVALMYNVIPDDDSKKNSIIDSRTQKKLHFKLYSNEDAIYLNNNKITITDNKFEIDIDKLKGKQELKFTNDLKEEVCFTYYISDINGFVKDFNIENEKTYIKTIDNIKIIYTSKDAKKINFIINLIKDMPDKTKINLKEITLSPTEHPSKAAGITIYDKITLYNISSYSNKQIKNIIFHEIAHTWSYELMKQKILDYSFTDFSKAIEKDNNYVSNYSKNKASEDFAESIAFYLINKTSFEKKYPARTEYIEHLLT